MIRISFLIRMWQSSRVSQDNYPFRNRKGQNCPTVSQKNTNQSLGGRLRRFPERAFGGLSPTWLDSRSASNHFKRNMGQKSQVIAKGHFFSRNECTCEKEEAICLEIHSCFQGTSSPFDKQYLMTASTTNRFLVIRVQTSCKEQGICPFIRAQNILN